MTAGGDIVIGTIFRRIIPVWIIDIQSKKKEKKLSIKFTLD